MDATTVKPYLERFSRLTPREQQIARAFATGMSSLEIAEQLGIARSTVKNHLTAIYHTLGLKPQAGRGRRLAAMLNYYKGYFDGVDNAGKVA
jgi:DNA-binding NarL/FixJ family response regulator